MNSEYGLIEGNNIKQVIIPVYYFNELSAKAKEKAISNALDDGSFIDDNWYENVYEDVKSIGKLIGIDISNIYFSGFYSQGDGACFEGSYGYVKNSAYNVVEYSPEEEEVFRIAEELNKIQEKNHYEYIATIRHSGRHYHKYDTRIEVWNEKSELIDEDIEREITKLMRDFMDWIYSSLMKEYKHLTSNSSISEHFIETDQLFTKNGETVIHISGGTLCL